VVLALTLDRAGRGGRQPLAQERLLLEIAGSLVACLLGHQQVAQRIVARGQIARPSHVGRVGGDKLLADGDRFASDIERFIAASELGERDGRLVEAEGEVAPPRRVLGLGGGELLE